MIGQMSDQRETVYEDFIDALTSTDVAVAESLLDRALKHADEAAWEYTINRMCDEWYKWLNGSSEYNTDGGCGYDLLEQAPEL